ncbi:hypothetical protein [Aurantimonas coralicida]|uniref:hypothetical protein n=1 Tax=Aurantimonas coralicida TaxID=182270 RepID=UPI001D197318|nr:hypothetical protein [Aurantimonas coralicida]
MSLARNAAFAGIGLLAHQGAVDAVAADRILLSPELGDYVVVNHADAQEAASAWIRMSRSSTAGSPHSMVGIMSNADEPRSLPKIVSSDLIDSSFFSVGRINSVPPNVDASGIPWSRASVGNWLLISPSQYGDVPSKRIYAAAGTHPTIGAVAHGASASAITWSMIRQSVEGWRTLPEDWDGNDGVGPSEEVIQAALRFLDAARQSLLRAPQPFVAGDGEVGFRWERGGSFGSVSFLDDGSIIAYVRAANGEPPFRLDKPVTEDFNYAELLENLVKAA